MHRELGSALPFHVNLPGTLLLIIHIRFNLFHIVFECSPEIVIIMHGFLIIIHDIS